MKYRRNLWTSLVAAGGLVILILDAKTALLGASEGIALCINTVIPSLFPFFVLSSVANSAYLGRETKILRPIGQLCGIPKGGESLLLLGLLGGYPVGAQGVAQAYFNGSIDKTSAKRMLGFCNNAGPAFIFGMLSGLFSNKVTTWSLWCIHIISALISGFLFPKKTNTSCRLVEQRKITFPEAIMIGIKTMSQVCAWIVLFRVILSFCNRWFLWLFPDEFRVVFYGILELSNGCIALYDLSNEGIKFILSACLLSFGGVCVAMQTVSVTKSLGVGYYFPGKFLQMLLSLMLSSLYQFFFFNTEQRVTITWLPLIILLVGIMYVSINKTKKVVAIPG